MLITTDKHEYVPTIRTITSLALSLSIFICYNCNDSELKLNSSQINELACNSCINSFDTAYNSYVYVNDQYVSGDVSVLIDERKVENLKIIDEIKNLKDNWNENGALAFSNEIIDKVKSLVLSLTFQPYIYPTANESIQFEYENERGDYIEFELFEDGKLKVFYLRSDKFAQTNYIDISSFDKVVIDFYEGKQCV